MKNKLLLGGLIATLMLGAAACSSSGPANANRTTNTTTTTTTTTANNANRAAPPASNTSNTATSNTASDSGAATAGAQDFTLVNRTGVVINKLFISPHDADDWQEDVLGRDTLGDGESVEIKFHRNEKAAMWDMRIEDTQGNAIEWENLNLLEISRITLHYDKATGKASAETQ